VLPTNASPLIVGAVTACSWRFLIVGVDALEAFAEA
jgi:hypothetical protein